MNKEELTEELSKHLFDRKQARIAVERMLELIKDALKNGDKVVLSNFGTFRVKESRPMNLKNPMTGAKISVPSKIRVRFKSSENILK